MRTLKNQRSYSQSSYLSKSGIFIISNQTYKRVTTYDMGTYRHIERYLYFKTQSVSIIRDIMRRTLLKTKPKDYFPSHQDNSLSITS